MRKYYGLIKDCYKHEAGMGTTGKIFGVPIIEKKSVGTKHKITKRTANLVLQRNKVNR